MKTRSFIFGNRAFAMVTSILSACATVAPQSDGQRPHQVAADNQAGIWVEGRLLYASGQFLPAADLFQMAYRLKPAQRISQNIGMAYFKAAQFSEYPDVLRLEYVRRALPYLRSYRVWLVNDYGRTRNVAAPLAETDQRLTEAQLLERELSAKAEACAPDTGSPNSSTSFQNQ